MRNNQRLMTKFAWHNCMPSGVWLCKLRAEATKKWRLVEG